MIIQLLFAFGLTCLTVLTHAVGSSFAISLFARLGQQLQGKQNPWKEGILVSMVVGILLFLHLLEAGWWGLFYLLSAELPDFQTAIYFSITSYTTVGYGDVVLPAPWRILGPIESAVGILMFGWSTAIIVAAVTRIHESRKHSHDEQPEAPKS